MVSDSQHVVTQVNMNNNEHERCLKLQVNRSMNNMSGQHKYEHEWCPNLHQCCQANSVYYILSWTGPGSSTLMQVSMAMIAGLWTGGRPPLTSGRTDGRVLGRTDGRSNGRMKYSMSLCDSLDQACLAFVSLLCVDCGGC